MSDSSEPNLIESLPLATGQDWNSGWIISPNFLLEVKAHLEDGGTIDLEEIECVLLALNRLQAKYRLGEKHPADV